MRKALAIAWKDILVLSRDFVSFILLLAMPLLLILVLGTAFGGMFVSNAAPFQITLAFVDQDNGEMARLLRDEVLQGPDLKEMIRLRAFASPDEARQAVRAGNAEAALIVPSGFSRAVMGESESGLEVLANPDSTIKAGVIRSIAEAFTTEVMARGAMVRLTLTELLSRNLIQPQEATATAARWVPELQSLQSQIKIQREQAVTPGAQLPGAMAYYSISMGVMYVLFAANTAGGSILTERRTRTLLRLFSAPLERRTVLVGKLLGVFLLALIQFLLVVAFTALAYRVSWGSSIPGLALMILATVFCLAGLSALLASLYRSESQAAAIGPAVALLLTFLAGGMWVFTGGPQWLDILSHASPVRWSIDGFLTLMLGGGLAQILLPIGVLLGLGAVFFGIGFLRIRKSYDVA